MNSREIQNTAAAAIRLEQCIDAVGLANQHGERVDVAVAVSVLKDSYRDLMRLLTGQPAPKPIS